MLREIRNFCVTADSLNFTLAAKFLYIEQPALSKQISKLEEELGVKLFRRTTRQVNLTPAGEAFLQLCRSFISSCDVLPKSFPNNSIGGKGHGIVIGIGETVDSEIIMSALGSFFENHEGISLSFIRCSDEKLPNLLISEDANFVYTFLPLLQGDPRYDYISIQKVHLKVLLWKTHPLVNKERIYLRDLKDDSFILNTSAPPMLMNMLHGMCEANGFFPKISAKVDSPQMSMIMTCAKQGITITTFTTSDIMNTTSLVCREIDASGVPADVFENDLVLAWRKDTCKTSELLQQFVDSVRKGISNLNVVPSST